jgi:hypothetical protein
MAPVALDLPELFADVREAFGRLEAAISLSEPARCLGYVTDSFYESLDSAVRLLADTGRRRIHADFEVLDVTLQQARDDGSVTVRLRAVSTLEEFDAGSQPRGEPRLFVWLQQVDMVRQDAASLHSRWLIADLGALTIEKQVSGPVQPLDQSTLDELEAREAERAAHRRDDEDWSEGHTHVAMTFLRLKGVGM